MMFLNPFVLRLTAYDRLTDKPDIRVMLLYAHWTIGLDFGKVSRYITL